jgi:hypothetical protein
VEVTADQWECRFLERGRRSLVGGCCCRFRLESILPGLFDNLYVANGQSCTFDDAMANRKVFSRREPSFDEQTNKG